MRKKRNEAARTDSDVRANTHMPHAPTQELGAVLSQQQILLHAIDWHIQVIYMLIVNMSIRLVMGLKLLLSCHLSLCLSRV